MKIRTSIEAIVEKPWFDFYNSPMEQVEDIITEFHDIIPQEKSIKELKPQMGSIYNELDVQVAYKEGYNKAIREVKQALIK